jgi:MFS transporter, DHA1 family, inner membrane transport protein
MPLPILALALATFAIGTTEFVIMGILPDVARDLAVSIPSAGLLVTGYALGVAAGAPLLAALTSRMPRKQTLLLLMAIFIVGNVLCAAAPGYGALMLARVLTSFAHGAFFGIGAVVAASLVEPDKRASAIALMFTGLALANVLGVPLGTFVGQALGWRATFWAVTVLGVVAAGALVALVPECPDEGSADLRSELGVLARPQVWLALLMTVFGFGGVFVVFTYIAPILEVASGYAPSSVTWLLVLFGAGLTIGNSVGGRLADRGELRALFAVFIVLIAVMGVFSFTMHGRAGAAVTIFAWGVAAFATVPGLQARVLRQAAGAPNLASTLNIGAFNIGNAFGAWLGGRVLSAGYALDALPVAAALVTVAAVGVTAIALRLDARGDRAAAGGFTPFHNSDAGRSASIRKKPAP